MGAGLAGGRPVYHSQALQGFFQNQAVSKGIFTGNSETYVCMYVHIYIYACACIPTRTRIVCVHTDGRMHVYYTGTHDRTWDTTLVRCPQPGELSAELLACLG